MTARIEAEPHTASEIDSGYAWMRLAVALAIGTVGSVGMWSFVVALPAVQADFGVARGEVSLPFTLTMIGFGGGGILMGRLADRFNILVPIIAGAILLALGYVLSGLATNLWQFALAALVAATVVGRPRVGAANATTCRTCSAVAPASSARRACEWTAPSRRPPMAMPSFTSSRVLASSGPALAQASPSAW